MWVGGDGSTQLVLEVAKARAALTKRKHSALVPGQRGSMGGGSQNRGWIFQEPALVGDARRSSQLWLLPRVCLDFVVDRVAQPLDCRLGH